MHPSSCSTRNSTKASGITCLNRTLRRVPGGTRYNKGFDLLDDFRSSGKLLWRESDRIAVEQDRLKSWLTHGPHESKYLLMKAKLYDKLKPAVDGLAVSLYREPDLKRNELMLLRIERPVSGPVATADESLEPTTLAPSDRPPWVASQKFRRDVPQVAAGDRSAILRAGIAFC